MKEEKITALLIKPYYEPQVVEISNTLEAKQKAVGGYIEVLHPFDENVTLICNEEGKITGLALNRGLYDERGKLCEIIAGDFLLCAEKGEDFASLTPEQIAKYTARFKQPEEFISFDGQLVAVPVPPQFIKKPSLDTYRIYQVKMLAPGSEGADLRHNVLFMGTDTLKHFGLAIEPKNYEMVYSDTLEPDVTPETLFRQFNTDIPPDYRGRSMSVSDVVVLVRNGKETAHFCDSIGFVTLDSFITPESPAPAKTQKRKPRQRGGDGR